MRSEDITIVIGIIGLILAGWPLLKIGSKYFDYPFCEFDTSQSRIYKKQAGILWKINWAITLCIILFAYCNNIIVVMGLAHGNKSYDFLAIYIILTAGNIIKDLFHNIFAYKKRIEKIFIVLFDDIEILHLIVFLELSVLLTIVLLAFFQALGEDKIVIVSLITLELCYCLYRALEEMCNLIHLHPVTSLYIKMNDGTVYEEIIEYSESHNSIRIMNASRTVIFLSKDAINSISKILEKNRLLDKVKESVNKKEQGVRHG